MSSFQALQPATSPARRAASTPIAAAKAAAPYGGQPAHGLKRHAHERSGANLAGSPPRKETELIQAKHQRRSGKTASNSGGKGASAASSDSETTSVRKPRGAPGSAKKHQREASGVAAPGSSTSQRQSPLRKRPEGAAPVDMHTLAAASAAASASLRTPPKPAVKAAHPGLPSKFAGPAFTNSPTPDSLPIPTSSLLLQVQSCTVGWLAFGACACVRSLLCCLLT
jgi:hypothetical protein